MASKKSHRIGNHGSRLHAIFLFVGALAALYGCSENDSEPLNPLAGNPVGTVINATGCKSFSDSYPDTEPAIDQDCLFYRFVEPGTLLLTHINAGFNCCPETIYADIRLEDDILTIAEIEDGSVWCDCLCLFDVDYRIENLSPGTYTIRVEEPYKPHADEPLEFAVTLDFGTSGIFCVARTGYPWGLDASVDPVGRFIGHTGCKSLETTGSDGEWPWGEQCLSYRYGPDSTLNLVHINAPFNCCPGELTGQIDIEQNVIVITEWETENGCRCICPYDLEYRIGQLIPGVYDILVIDISHGEYYESLHFEANLTEPAEGMYCEE